MKWLWLAALLAGCSRGPQLPVFAVPVGVQVQAPKTPDVPAGAPSADAEHEKNGQYWAFDTIEAYLGQLLARAPRFKTDGVHRLIHAIPDAKALTFRVQGGDWVEYVLVDLPDPKRKYPPSRTWGTQTATGRFRWTDFGLTGHATQGIEASAAGEVHVYWEAGSLAGRVSPVAGQLQVVDERWDAGKVESSTVRPLPEYQRNSLDNVRY